MTTNTELAAAKRFLEGMSGGVCSTPVLCAVSGGMDSMCLLHLLMTWGKEHGIAVTAAHYNHLHRGEESYRDEQFVRDWCARHDVPLVWDRGDMIAHAAETGQTLEEAGRELRYAFLAQQKTLTGSTFILTAHHADDNAETMLLNLLRGTGLRGLAGIPERRDDIARPFLRVSRAEIAEYAAAHHIKYIEDTTNALDVAARNVLRHHVLPVLRELNPRAMENMARTAEQLRSDEEALSRLAEELLRRSCRFEGETARLDAAACLEAERAVRARAVHVLLSRLAGRRKDLTARHVEAVCGLLQLPVGKTLSLPYGLTARREETELVLSRAAEIPEEKTLSVGDTVTFGRWTVSVKTEGPGRELHIPGDAVLTVTPWDRNDRMVLPGSRGERSLKRLCSDLGVTPAERDSLPVFRVNGKCAAVPGVGVDSDFLSGEDRTVFVDFQFQTEENKL